VEGEEEEEEEEEGRVDTSPHAYSTQTHTTHPPSRIVFNRRRSAKRWKGKRRRKVRRRRGESTQPHIYTGEFESHGGCS